MFVSHPNYLTKKLLLIYASAAIGHDMNSPLYDYKHTYNTRIHNGNYKTVTLYTRHIIRIGSVICENIS